MINHIDEILAICDRVFGPDGGEPVPTEQDMLGGPARSYEPLVRERRPRGTGGAVRVNDLNWAAAKRLAERGGGRLCNNTVVEVEDDGGFSVRFHATKILRWHPHINSVTVAVNGYTTTTTKQRLNSLLHEFGYRIYAVKREWYVRLGDHSEPYEEGITLALD